MTLILPFDVAEHVIGVLRRRHGEHLAQLEIARGLTVGTLRRPSVDLLASPGHRLRTQKAPCVLVGIVSPEEDDEIDAQGTADVRWQLLVEVYVEGRPRDRRDIVLRRDAHMWTVVECVMQRVPLEGDPIERIDFSSFAHDEAENDTASSMIGIGVLTFDLTVPNAWSAFGLPPDNSPLPPGSPGGPPLPDGSATPAPSTFTVTDEVDRA